MKIAQIHRAVGFPPFPSLFKMAASERNYN